MHCALQSINLLHEIFLKSLNDVDVQVNECFHYRSGYLIDIDEVVYALIALAKYPRDRISLLSLSDTGSNYIRMI